MDMRSISCGEEELQSAKRKIEEEEALRAFASFC
jgi:hypothetical protein